MNRRALFAGLGTIVLLVAIGLSVLLLTGGGDGNDPRASERTPASAEAEQATGDLNTCAGMVQDEGRACYSRELAKIVNDAADPLAAVEGITAAAYADKTGFLLANCHGIMHTVAREYALQDASDAGEADGQPAADQRPGLLGRLRPRSRHRGRAGDRARGPEGRHQALRGLRDPLPALQLHARLRPRVHAAQQRQHRAGAADVRAARLGRRARLRAGRLPRLLVRDQRDRLHQQAQGRRHRAARAVRRAARRVRAALLVPRVRGDGVGHAHRVRRGRRAPVRRPRGPAAPGVRHRLDASSARPTRATSSRSATRWRTTSTSPPASAGPRSRT